MWGCPNDPSVIHFPTSPRQNWVVQGLVRLVGRIHGDDQAEGLAGSGPVGGNHKGDSVWEPPFGSELGRFDPSRANRPEYGGSRPRLPTLSAVSAP